MIKKNILYLISILLIGITILVFYLGTTLLPIDIPVSYRIGFVLGKSITFFFFIYGTWKGVNIFIRPIPVKRGSFFLCFCSLFLLCTSFLTVNTYKVTNQSIKTDNELQKISNWLITGIKPDLNQTEYSVEEYGHHAYDLKLMRDHCEHRFDEFHRFENEIAEAKIDKILSQETLSDFSNLVRAWERINLLIEQLHESYRRKNELITKSNLEVNQLLDKGLISGEFYQGFTAGKREGQFLTYDNFQLRKEAYNLFKDTLRFLIDAYGSYMFINETLYFDYIEDAEKYNAYISRISELAEEKEDLQKRQEEKLKD